MFDVGEEHLLLEIRAQHHLHLHAASFVPRLKAVVHLLVFERDDACIDHLDFQNYVSLVAVQEPLKV